MARRGKSLWTFRERADGRFEGRATIGGKAYSVYGKTETEAREKAALKSGQVVLGEQQEPSELLLLEYLEAWMQYKRASLRPATIYVYQRAIDLIRPSITTTKLTALTAVQLRVIYAKIESEGYRGQVDVMLRSALRHAVREGYLKVSPLDAVRKPPIMKREYYVLNEAEIRAVVKSAREHAPNFYAAFVLALSTGMRQGELLGLSWSDVDLRSECVFVNAQAVNVNTAAPIIGPPKTASSRRRIDLPEPAIKALKWHRERQLGRGLIDKPVFCSTTGTLMWRSSFEKIWWNVKKLAGLEGVPVRFHDLRHTVASHLLSAGESPANVAKLLGHKSSAITEVIYGHLMPGASRKLTDRMAGIALGQSGSELSKDSNDNATLGDKAACLKNTLPVD